MLFRSHWLFNLPAAKIDVVIHPQSLIHSMVQYKDGSIISQMGPSDMRVPISSVLGWPKRIASNVTPLDLLQNSALNFMPLDENRFKCFKLAKLALEQGGYYPCVLNAANEIAVSLFLKKKIGFLQIGDMVESALNEFSTTLTIDTIDNIVEIDRMARLLSATLG